MTLLPDTTIWRYMSFLKYVELLRTASLYCCRADLLDDKTEGEWLAHLEVQTWLEQRKYYNDSIIIRERLIQELINAKVSSPQEVEKCVTKSEGAKTLKKHRR